MSDKPDLAGAFAHVETWAFDLDNTLDALRSDHDGHADIHVLHAVFAVEVGGAGQHALLVPEIALGHRNGGRGGLILSPQISPGQTLSFTRHVDELGSTVRPLTVECSKP